MLSYVLRSRLLAAPVVSNGSSGRLRLLRNSSSIRDLQNAFRDPSSPFYIAPGTRGPESPDAAVLVDVQDGMTGSREKDCERAVAAEGKRKLTDMGYDPTCFWEQKVVWGDHDAFQHVNNTRYVRYIESGRIEFLTALGHALGGPAKAKAMITGKGISLILKSISVDFKRPVTFPDTLLIGHKPYLQSGVTVPKYHFNCLAIAYSYAQQAIVAESDSVMVWYDYDSLKKCYPGDETWDLVLRKMNRAASSMRMSNPITVNVWVISPDTRSERRFDLHSTVGNLKNKLELSTGIPVQNQLIALYNSEDDSEAVAVLSDDDKPLGFYRIRDWQFLKITDTNPSMSFTGQLSDVSQVEKFELSDSAYAQRQDTVLAYKQRHKIGRFAEKKEESISEPVLEQHTVDIAVGSRCEVESAEQDFRKRGTVRYVGTTEFGKGVWVGIEYDEPIGKNDGSVQGYRYFTCSPKYGVFVQSEKVRTGDYPVEEINFDDEEM